MISGPYMAHNAADFQSSPQDGPDADFPPAPRWPKPLAMKGEADSDLKRGMGALRAGRPLDAIVPLTAAASRLDLPVAHANLGLALMAADRFGDAIAALGKALAQRPGDPVILGHLARAEAAFGRMADAGRHYRELVGSDRDGARLRYALAGVLLDAGQTTEALDQYRAALGFDPDHGPSLRMLAQARRHPEPDPDTERVESAYRRAAPASETRKHLAFAMGKLHEDRGDYAAAFDRFAEGNRLHRAGYVYDVANQKTKADQIVSLFGPDIFERFGDAGHADRSPVFILGMPRSGTTLTEQILAGHPDIFGAGELRMLSNIMLEAGIYRPNGLFAAQIGEGSGDKWKKAGQTYVARTRQIAPRARLISNKMPGNFWRIGAIRLMLPNARIVHCTRGPADNCLSIYKNFFSVDGHHYAYDLEELGRYYNTYRRLMRHWHEVLPGFVHDVSYERLVADPQTEAKAIFAHLGLDWRPEVLDFHTSARAVKTASAEQVRRPLYRSSVGLHERYGAALDPLLRVLAEEPSG